MIAWLYNRMALVPAVFIDGFLYVGIAVLGSIAVFLSSDESYKYLNPYTLYWAKGIDGILLSGVTALKMFRSTSYADHQTNKQKQDEKTNIITTIPDTVPTVQPSPDQPAPGSGIDKPIG